jgi:hypothetical protein
MKVDYSKVADKVKFWKSVIENVKEFSGSSPPAVFVGRAFYPKIYVGILAPPNQQTAADILDSPEKWYEEKASIEQILNYRSQLIYSRFKTSTVKRLSGKFIDITQELSMAKKPTGLEIKLKEKPRFAFSFDGWSQPIGNPAPIDNVMLTENPSVERKVDYIISDIDLKAERSVLELYRHEIPVSRIQKMFSVGLLGLKTQRRFVPTRWGITAVDDTIGKILIERIKDFQQMNKILLFQNDYLANHFEILLIPENYQFEFIESWDLDKPSPMISADYESYFGRKTYAINTHGGYYAARVAALEYLDRIKRQSTILIVREVRPEYYADVGVWKIRETVRDAFNKPFEKFDTINQAMKRICERMMIKNKWISKSNLLKNLKQQRKLRFFIS